METIKIFLAFVIILSHMPIAQGAPLPEYDGDVTDKFSAGTCELANDTWQIASLDPHQPDCSWGEWDGNTYKTIWPMVIEFNINFNYTGYAYHKMAAIILNETKILYFYNDSSDSTHVHGMVKTTPGSIELAMYYNDSINMNSSYVELAFLYADLPPLEVEVIDTVTEKKDNDIYVVIYDVWLYLVLLTAGLSIAAAALALNRRR
jgi:hypothetical protein